MSCICVERLRQGNRMKTMLTETERPGPALLEVYHFSEAGRTKIDLQPRDLHGHLCSSLISPQLYHGRVEAIEDH